jgi:hypothetical protein
MGEVIVAENGVLAKCSQRNFKSESSKRSSKTSTVNGVTTRTETTTTNKLEEIVAPDGKVTYREIRETVTKVTEKKAKSGSDPALEVSNEEKTIEARDVILSDDGKKQYGEWAAIE